MTTKNNITDFLNNLSVGSGEGTAVYFLGIGGIGMSALARYFNSRGVKVSGYDKTETELTKKLVSEGISVHYDDNIQKADKNAVFVVYTPAVPKDHEEYNYFLNNDYTVLKRSEVLGMITASSFNICVAGTHGKTTTSTMIAHILRHSEFGCNAFLGGIASNYETNFWSSEKNVCVAEADEYDRSFLQLSPDIAVITAIDPDHLDIYGNEENFRIAFMQFSEKIKEDGLLIIKRGMEDVCDFKTKHQLSYSSTDASADCFAVKLKMKNGSYYFDMNIGNEVVEDFELNMGGMHNVENAVAAVVAARRAGVEDDKIRKALASFKGVKRRFEYIIKTDEIVMIDDYAHHPQELSALIKGAKGLFADKKCTVIFQPHLYTRTRDFATGFADSLHLADEIILLPIYPAREKPIEGVESEMIKELMQSEKVVCFSKEDLLNWVSEKKAKGEIEMLITAGAGDIDTLVTPIKNIIV